MTEKADRNDDACEDAENRWNGEQGRIIADIGIIGGDQQIHKGDSADRRQHEKGRPVPFFFDKNSLFLYR